MNLVIEKGRLTTDPVVRRNQEGHANARYTLAVDGYGDHTDFISCVAFNNSAEFAEKYLRKGMMVLVEGSIRTGSYTNKEGQKVYTTDVVVNHHEFCEKKSDSTPAAPVVAKEDEFMSIPDGIEEELPFV